MTFLLAGDRWITQYLCWLEGLASFYCWPKHFLGAYFKNKWFFFKFTVNFCLLEFVVNSTEIMLLEHVYVCMHALLCLCACMCVCVCVCAYTTECIDSVRAPLWVLVHVHTALRLSMRRCAYTMESACMCLRMCDYTSKHRSMCVHTPLSVCVCVCMCACVCVHASDCESVHTCMCAYTT